MTALFAYVNDDVTVLFMSRSFHSWLYFANKDSRRRKSSPGA